MHKPTILIFIWIGEFAYISTEVIKHAGDKHSEGNRYMFRCSLGKVNHEQIVQLSWCSLWDSNPSVPHGARRMRKKAGIQIGNMYQEGGIPSECKPTVETNDVFR
jgi:hypothetical protein